MPRLSRDSAGNNEKLWRDFKANGRSFPVVMSDSEEASSAIRQEACTHLVTHSSCRLNLGLGECHFPFAWYSRGEAELQGKNKSFAQRGDRKEEPFVVLPRAPASKPGPQIPIWPPFI